MKAILILFSILSLVGCANIKPQGPLPKRGHTVNLADSARVKQKLLAQHAEWKGTRFEYGGASKKGIDCSAFVQITFRSQLGLDIPRTTGQQVKMGVSVNRNRLRTGDLVFFKTGVTDRHVGVYLGDSLFLHASKSKGVTISSLENNYWASNYWLSKRIVPDKEYTASLSHNSLASPALYPQAEPEERLFSVLSVLSVVKIGFLGA